MFCRGQETYSYYGPLNLLSYNVRRSMSVGQAGIAMPGEGLAALEPSAGKQRLPVLPPDLPPASCPA